MSESCIGRRRTAKFTCEGAQSQRYPASKANAAGLLCRALEKFFLYLKLETPPKNQLVQNESTYVQTDNSCPSPIFLEELTKLADFFGVYLAVYMLLNQR